MGLDNDKAILQDLCAHRYRHKQTHACVLCDHIEGNIEMDRILDQEDAREEIIKEYAKHPAIIMRASYPPPEPDIHEASKAFDDTHGIPDTGQRRQWTTGAVRDASEGKPEITQIYPEAARRLAQRVTDGAKKYSDYNWTKGIPIQVYLDSLDRHIKAFRARDVSEDHLGSALWNIQGMMFTEDRVKIGRAHV